MPEPDDYGNPDPDWLKIDWREHLRRVRLPGAEVNYVEIGEGEPIVFVHGISGSWQNWLENLPHFGRGRRAIALDLPGFGASPMPSWTIDMPAYGRLLHDFCEKLGVAGGAALVGNSMGGLVAGEAVLTAPGRFERSWSRPPA
jgi:pimeloyl-ACP methyl ester carboxylesterase